MKVRTHHRQVLRILYQSGGATRLELAEQAKLSPGVAFRVTKELLGEGWITEDGKAETHDGGRPPDRLVLNADIGHVVGVSLAGTQQAVVTNLRGDVLAHVEEPSSIRFPTEELIDSVDKLIGGVIQVAGVPESEVWGAGLSVEALVDPLSGVVSHYEVPASNAGRPRWDPVPMRDLIAERRPGWTVTIDRTSRALGLAESQARRHDDTKDFAYVLVDQGLSSALVFNGKPYLGPTRITGELAHVPVPGARTPCPCGSYGCLGTVASIPAILRAVDERLAESPVLTSLQPGLTIDQLVQVGEAGDKLAYRLLTDVGDKLGGALAFLLNLLGFELVVIGSRLAESSPFLAATHRAIRLQALPGVASRVRIEPSRIGDGANVRSAANLALHSIFVDDASPTPFESPAVRRGA